MTIGGTIPAADLSKAISNLEAWAVPAPQDKILIELGKLRLKTVTKDLTQDDLKIQVVAYLDKLRAYPAEAVESVLTSYADMHKWWPAWADLYEQLELHCAKRKKTLSALKNYRDPVKVPKNPGKSWQDMTKDEQNKMTALVTGAADGCKP